MASNRNNNTHYRPMRQQQPREENRDVRNSKYLAYILRYGAADHGLKMRPDGYVLVSDILELPDARRRRLSVVIIRVHVFQPHWRPLLSFEPPVEVICLTLKVFIFKSSLKVHVLKSCNSTLSCNTLHKLY